MASNLRAMASNQKTLSICSSFSESPWSMGFTKRLAFEVPLKYKNATIAACFQSYILESKGWKSCTIYGSCSLGDQRTVYLVATKILVAYCFQ